MRGLKIANVHAVVTIMPNCTYPGAQEIYREEKWWDGPLHESVLMYGLPRKMLWGLCKTYGDAYGLQSAHLVFPNLYGPGDRCDTLRSHALGALVKKIVDAHRDEKQTVDIWGSGTVVREWMHVCDGAEAVAAFLTRLQTAPKLMEGHPLFNVGIGTGVSILELAELIRASIDWNGRFVCDRSKPDGATKKLLNGQRFHALTGWAPRVKLRDGIRQTIEWYREHAESEAVYASA
jgi:GDP-L-fucose synthase